MRKLTIALMALAAIAVPALAEAASQQRQTTPVTSPVSTGNGASSSKASGKVAFRPFSITKKIDKASPIFFGQ
jgi:type VI protein secretion system component Hcp